MHGQQRQPDDHARSRRGLDGGDGRARGRAAREDEIKEGAGGTSLRDDQEMVWLHLLSGQGTRPGAHRVDAHHALLQPQARVEHRELARTDEGGAGKNVSGGLKERARAPVRALAAHEAPRRWRWPNSSERKKRWRDRFRKEGAETFLNGPRAGRARPPHPRSENVFTQPRAWLGISVK